MAADETEPGRRERKKRRTREAILDAAYRLFERHGYERTTVNEIAAEADVSPGTFFNHFPAKESVLFADRAELLALGPATVADRRPGETVVELLVRMIARMLSEFEPGGDRERLRLELVMGSPALRGIMLQRMFDVQDQLAAALRDGDPDLGELESVAVVGAVMGAATAAVQAALKTGRPLDEALTEALGHLTRHLRPAA
ncbi:helix-turn-helix domain-containing protein [Glycomyces sp. NPDC047369]